MVEVIKRLFQALTALLLLPQVLCDFQRPSVNPGTFTQSKSIGDCHACKILVESFKKGLERTARGKYEGGDAAWEEEKLKKSYKRSEMRLVDIQESLCNDVKDYSIQCHHMAERAEEFIEEWWAQNPDESEDLYTYICIDRLRVCCPEHHFGVDCTPCPGDHANLCNGRGKCRGDGTRKGNGTCLCNPGYTGDNCNYCSSNYYEATKDGQKECLPCHKACLDTCRGSSSRDCVACKPGYRLDTYDGCLDINECLEDICKRNEFCVNAIGSHKCVECHRACDGCHGDGPDMCRKCAKGFYKDKEWCIRQATGPDDENRHQSLTNARYITYISLLVVSGIVTPYSSTWGYSIGFVTLSYIMGAEYYCMVNDHPGILAGYYEATKDGQKECLPCHKACLDTCRGSSSRDCVACKPGYRLDTYDGCLDINECLEDICKRNEFCVNAIGSHKCVECHRACDGCHGDGPDMCRKCAKGFYKDKEWCIRQATGPDDENRHQSLTNARYITYISLLVVSGIVTPYSSTWGYSIGFVTLSYIMGAEYYCMVNDHPGILVNLKDFDIMHMIRSS